MSTIRESLHYTSRLEKWLLASSPLVVLNSQKTQLAWLAVSLRAEALNIILKGQNSKIIELKYQKMYKPEMC